MCFIAIFSNNTDVQIGFDREFYSVNESNGRVTLGIAVLVGQLSDNVVIQLSTQDNTAQGEMDIAQSLTLIQINIVLMYRIGGSFEHLTYAQ